MEMECRRCPVRQEGLCRSASDEQLPELNAIKLPSRHVPAGAAVFLEGDACDRVYIVRHGWAVASTLHENGRRQVLRFALAGSLLGFEKGQDGTMPCTVEAVTDLVLCPLPWQRLLKLCEAAPNLALRVVALLAEETVSDWRLLGGLGTCRAPERIARLLLALHDRYRKDTAPGAAPKTDAELPISQTLIADATGLTAVHVCRTLKEMRVDGLLALARGRLRIMDRDRLRDLAGMTDAERFPPAGKPWVSRPDPCASAAIFRAAGTSLAH